MIALLCLLLAQWYGNPPAPEVWTIHDSIVAQSQGYRVREVVQERNVAQQHGYEWRGDCQFPRWLWTVDTVRFYVAQIHLATALKARWVGRWWVVPQYQWVDAWCDTAKPRVIGEAADSSFLAPGLWVRDSIAPRPVVNGGGR